MIDWFVLRTHHQQAERAQRHLQQQDYQTLLPLARIESRNSKGLPVSRIRPLFGSYLFVGVASDQRWQPIASTFGVRSFIGYLPGQLIPPRVSESDIEELRSRIAAVGGMFPLGLSRPCDIKPGLMVRVLFGPFRDRSALVSADCGSRVEVLLQYSGALSKLRLPKELLTAA